MDLAHLPILQLMGPALIESLLYRTITVIYNIWLYAGVEQTPSFKGLDCYPGDDMS